ncbi:ABC transporter ATP-binding protein [Cellulomonas fimi]|uniref:ABC transporter ATP-binding protein n=1 Tax=Cellulomonas fimi TaxID=1708 RepID=UPI00234CB689|nr:ABC transporter ATP-binding protein [Cellulomonas fimi]MDC7120851.1 ABC transporter ATP-binding protein [Cellulomonas fimi]
MLTTTHPAPAAGPRPATTPAPAAVASGVVKTYGHGTTEVRALDGVDLTISAGQLTAVMGPSGSGKSTLMHAMAGLDAVDAGSIRLGGTELTDLSEKQRTLLRRERLGFVFQSFNLVPSLTAAENIALPLRLAGRTPDGLWLEELVTTLGLQDRLTHRPSELSGGQQQRVAVARALVTRPEIVFADEPTGNLDSRHGQALLAFLQRAARELGQTVVMVTHDPTAASYADRVVFLADGRAANDLTDPTVPTVLATMAGLEQPASRAEA